MAKTKEDAETLEVPKNGKDAEQLGDAEFIEQLMAETDQQSDEPPRTDVYFGNCKRFTKVKEGTFVGVYATMGDIEARWPKAFGTFRRVFYYRNKEGKRVRTSRDEDLGSNTFNRAVPIPEDKIAEMFGYDIPWIEKKKDERPQVSDQSTDQAKVVYINGPLKDPEFRNDDGYSYYQELGPDGNPTLHFYHIYEDEQGKKEKVYFEDESFSELTSDEERLLLQAHSSPTVLQTPIQVPQSPPIQASDLDNPQYLTIKLYEIANKQAEEARLEAREERKATRDMVMELSKAMAQGATGGSQQGFGLKDFASMWTMMRDMMEDRIPQVADRVSPVKEAISVFKDALGMIGEAKKMMPNPQQMELVREIQAQQAAAKNGDNKQ